MFDLDAALLPPTPTAAAALDVVRTWSTPAMVNHCLRSMVWATALADSEGRDHDHELLFVAAMLHNLGVTPHFDAHATPFEEAGGAVAWTFAAAAGWSPARRDRVRQVIERHMWTAVDPDLDIEGHLLEVATSLDVSGSSPERWDPGLRAAVVSRLPRLGFADEFDSAIHAQAIRKPGSAAERLDRSGNVRAGEQSWTS
ncbi:HD domain-containing protein [Curtobacterium sp. Leaf261]|uniref:HD domain-containing protein n=1 Tax=Curtobacterium sp. Leaf261 TaxID=1736311 RepID=UPI00070037D7|nr:HD domain-containing protein [Curtobacterium sp. Leaf261]KQO64563.1 hypothetical protein ASF23_16425 [Curtobacterium sp. Leaf261]